MRFFPILLVAGLLAGTAAAFAVTENLKLERSPILRTRIAKRFGPLCNCEHQRASIDFDLRRSDRATFVIVDLSGRVIRTLADATPLLAGRQHFTWDGRDDENVLMADGIYQPRIHLAHQHRTILLPNRIQLDTAAPKIALLSLRPLVISPDGDNHFDHLTARSKASEPARLLLYVNGRLSLRRRPFRTTDLVWWPRAGRFQPREGRYRIQLAAEDLVGNEGRLTNAVFVRVRYIQLGRAVIRARAGGRFAVSVSTDATTYRWRIGNRSGRARRGRLLVLQAGAPGRYVLVVSIHRHSDRALLIVGPGP